MSEIKQRGTSCNVADVLIERLEINIHTKDAAFVSRLFDSDWINRIKNRLSDNRPNILNIQVTGNDSNAD